MSVEIPISINQSGNEAAFDFAADTSGTVRRYFAGQISAYQFPVRTLGTQTRLELADAMVLIRELSRRQPDWGFKFTFADEPARLFVTDFVVSVREVKSAAQARLKFTEAEAKAALISAGFAKRALTTQQSRDLVRLASLTNGANFSVPGAGKTTVTLALNTLVMPAESTMLVICPKSAFSAWEEIVDECFTAFDSARDGFVRLSGDSTYIRDELRESRRRYVINYEMATQHAAELRYMMSTRVVHLVIDESHRIKAGQRSLRGAVAMQLSTLANRRDILSGTPMPQGSSDIASQADFLWPGVGIGRSIETGKSPTAAMAGLFVRTTKEELGLPDVVREFRTCEMHDAQLALYSILADRTIAQFSRVSNDPAAAISQMRASTIRLLQASVNPALTSPAFGTEVELLRAAIAEGPSPKLLLAAEIARENALAGRKTVIWTIFTDTLLKMRNMLQDLNAVVIYGGNVRGGDGDEIDRDVALSRFLSDDGAFVLIANAAAASEGLSLHMAAHEAIYVDRTYNAAHFLQSIDRIHRLGLPPDTVTRITVLQTKTPDGIGNIDLSVSRRLSLKTANLEALLSDPDLREIAMAEDDAPLPVDADMDRDDVIDLVNELESRSRGPRGVI
jgi:SNF2 family DNA or RNA helicase